MDVLKELINVMSKEEIQAYKLYTLRKNAEKERKDIVLFDSIKKNREKYSEGQTAQLLYGNAGKNSFYRLKNRLTSNIFKSLSVHHFDDSVVAHIHHLLGLSDLFYKKRSFELAIHCLKKAESKATSSEQYELLDVVHAEFIKISQEIIFINPSEYIKKREENTSRLEKLRVLENTLAVLSYKLKTTQNFTSKKTDIIPFLEGIISNLVEDKTLLTLKFRTKIYRAVSQVLLSKKEYAALEEYLVETYNSFLTENLFTSDNHDVKLQMLTYIVNALFKNDKIKESLSWAKELEKGMDEFNSVLKSKYQIYYYNALVNNYNVIDKNKSISILEEIKESTWMKSDPYLGIFVYVNLALNWFDKFEYRKSLRNFQQLKLHEKYQNTSISLKFKWAIGELIVRFMSGRTDSFDTQLSELKAEYLDQIEDEFNARDKEFLEILTTIRIEGKGYTSNPVVKQFIQSESNDDELINYNSWLKSVK